MADMIIIFSYVIFMFFAKLEVTLLYLAVLVKYQ